MKKQFNRMRQLANQTVGRAEKTEVLSDDLLQIERRMELVRLVSHNTHKRLVSCLQGQLGTDSEKRHKKLPLTTLSQAMQEGGGQLGDESLIGKMMDVCGEAESKLASEMMQHEVQLERDILDPLNQVAEVEIPNILKQRKQLAKLVLDYDSAKTRWYQAAKSNNQAMAAKADSLKDEMDEALNKVEICKDQLSADMYNFASKEGEYARYYVLLLETQAEYHRRSLAALEAAIPTIQIQQDSWMEKPAFGTLLEEHLKRSNREIALPMEACVMMLLETGMKEEGLFRIAAGASKLKKLKAALDCSTSQLEEFYSDPHAVAGALKSYLRELPEPLMTFGLYDEWLQSSSVSDPDKRLQALWVTCDHLPKTHKANLRYLVKFLAKLAQDSDVNKMSTNNIAIVLGPNLLWAKAEGTLAEMAAATSLHVVAIIEPIIQHADWFFPEEVDFNVSGMFALPSHPATPDPEPSLERKRPGSQVGQDGDSHTPRKDSPARELMSTPPPQRNGSVHLAVGTPYSQGGSRGPSPHLVRRGTKKQAPAPPKQASPFAFHPSSTQMPGSTHYPPITPRRHSSKDSPIHAPSHPPPQPPQPHQAHVEPEPSPPSTPTPPGTPPHDGPVSNQLYLHHSGSLPRPSRPAPKPRPRPNMPPPPQPAANDDGNDLLNSASKIITDGGLVLKGIGRALIPEVIVDQQGDSSAGQEPASSPAPNADPDTQSESTAL
ncbi:rho GTPase-activating protein 17b isoform X3 [Hippoglossus hippoglossus]|uniref:rho GTPase-activating protein 17b isoform X3 n=1 Tax=Hippoglossus hippoglossus TaxID=8267 RepID=UPI00148D1FE6|nr:rho GTPase-activating protein 17b isoform X3 [Hippoglossus hippoglossus]XP_035036662.1 rho GTPase-activating protein 17b isoform X3 [Hippoglossus stenolepis]